MKSWFKDSSRDTTALTEKHSEFFFFFDLWLSHCQLSSRQPHCRVDNNFWFSGLFMGYKMEALARNGLTEAFFDLASQPAIICSTLTIKIPQRHYGIFIVNFEHITHLVLVFLLLTLSW